MPINNQQYRGEIGVFNNKIRVIKWYYNFLDFQKSSSTKVFDFESLLMALDALASFHFESLVYYVMFILQCTRRVNFYTLTSSYIFQVLVFSHIYFYSRLIELSGDTLDLSLSPIKASLFATGTLVVSLRTIVRKSNL